MNAAGHTHGYVHEHTQAEEPGFVPDPEMAGYAPHVDDDPCDCDASAPDCECAQEVPEAYRAVDALTPLSFGTMRPDDVLPARRTDIELHTADGLTLVGELAVPAQGDPLATLVLLHPLPTHGGFMDSHVFRKASYRLPELAQMAVLRFNTRGTSSPRGTSEGAFDHAQGERFDVAAAISYADLHGLPNIWLVGWSFGTDLTMMYGCDPDVRGAVLLSPPLRWSQPEHLARWAASGSPVTALIPELDDFLQPAEAREKFAAIPHAQVHAIEGCKHLWVGEKYVRTALNHIVHAVRQGSGLQD